MPEFDKHEICYMIGKKLELCILAGYVFFVRRRNNLFFIMYDLQKQQSF